MCTPFKSGYALTIGVGADLPNTVDDAQGLTDILKDEGRCAYPAEQVHTRTGENATRKAILTALDQLAQSTDPQSTAVVYFSGHGYRARASIGICVNLRPAMATSLTTVGQVDRGSSNHISIRTSFPQAFGSPALDNLSGLPAAQGDLHHLQLSLDTFLKRALPGARPTLSAKSAVKFTHMASIGEAYYLLPHGYDVERLSETAISGAEFTEKLRAIPARKLLVLLDCCHAGGIGDAKAPGLELTKSPLPPEAASLLAEGSGRVLIASSQEDELSFAGRPYSAFTLALTRRWRVRGWRRRTATCAWLTWRSTPARWCPDARETASIPFSTSSTPITSCWPTTPGATSSPRVCPSTWSRKSSQSRVLGAGSAKRT
jgi:hypothetical protein